MILLFRVQYTNLYKVVDMVLDLRAKAKADKDWATSDQIREEWLWWVDDVLYVLMALDEVGIVAYMV